MNSKRRAKYAYLFILPFFIAFIIFKIYPIFYTLYLSFCSYDPLGAGSKFIGLQNYTRLIKSGFFFQSVLNTLIIWIISIIPQLTIALILALILSSKWIKGRNALRSIYYFPNLVTPVTIGVLFGMLFSSPGGTIDVILKTLGLTKQAINFAYSPFLSRFVVGIAICWQNFGYNVIFFTAGLNSIPADVYEAAEVDGANSLQKALKITLPLMKPILIYVMVTSVIGGLQIFDVSKMVFKDIPGNTTTTMVQYMYESAFERWQLGYGAAASYGIFVIIVVFSIISLMITNRRNKKKEGVA